MEANTSQRQQFGNETALFGSSAAQNYQIWALKGSDFGLAVFTNYQLSCQMEVLLPSPKMKNDTK